MPGRLHDFRSSVYHDFFLVRVLFSVVKQNRGGKGQLGRLKVCSECVGQDFSYVCWARVRESLRLFACCLKGKSQTLVVVSWRGALSLMELARGWGAHEGTHKGCPYRGILRVRSFFGWRGRAPTRGAPAGGFCGLARFLVGGAGHAQGVPLQGIWRDSGL